MINFFKSEEENKSVASMASGNIAISNIVGCHSLVALQRFQSNDNYEQIFESKPNRVITLNNYSNETEADEKS